MPKARMKGPNEHILTISFNARKQWMDNWEAETIKQIQPSSLTILVDNILASFGKKKKNIKGRDICYRYCCCHYIWFLIFFRFCTFEMYDLSAEITLSIVVAASAMLCHDEYSRYIIVPFVFRNVTFQIYTKTNASHTGSYVVRDGIGEKWYTFREKML